MEDKFEDELIRFRVSVMPNYIISHFLQSYWMVFARANHHLYPEPSLIQYLGNGCGELQVLLANHAHLSHHLCHRFLNSTIEGVVTVTVIGDGARSLRIYFPPVVRS